MELRTPPTIQAERITLELVHEGDIIGTRSSIDNEPVEQFSLISSIHQEISQFIKKKLFQSIQLKNYEIGKEIEWLEKFIDLLNRNEVNNHEEAAPEQFTAAQRQEKLAAAEQRRQNLLLVLEDEERKQEKVDEVLNSQLNQIRLICPDSPIRPQSSNTNSFKLSNESWNSVISNSMKLQKIQMICEKLEHVEEDMEIKFWVDEVKRLVEPLDDQKKTIGIGFIVEFACWKNSQVIYNNAEFSNGYTELLDALVDQQDTKQQVFNQVKDFSASHEEKVDTQLIVIKMVAAMIVKMNMTDLVFREMFGEILSDHLVKVMQHSQFRSNHWNLVIDVVEKIGPHLESQLVDKFEKMFELLEMQSQGVTGVLQTRMKSSLRFWKPCSPTSMAHLPVLTAATETHQSVRNFTVIEHPVVAGIGIQRSSSSRSFEEDEMRRKMREELRREMEEEKRKEEEAKRMQEEQKRKEEEERRKIERMHLEFQESMKLQQEQMKRDMDAEFRRREEEDRQRRQMEEDRRKKEEEDRKRKQVEEENRRKLEEENRRKAIEEQNRRNQEEQRRRQEEAERRRREEEERKTRCTFLSNVPLRLHTEPEKNFNERMLDGKIIGLLFSGMWCGPCQEFVPVLNEFYQQVENDFEVLFISSDRSHEEMHLFLTLLHGNWFNLDFQSGIGNYLKTLYNVSSIPTLIIIRPNGNVVTNNGRGEVENCSNPAALVQRWKRM